MKGTARLAALREVGIGPYPAASVITLGLAAGIDVAISPGPRDPAFLLCLCGLVLGVGSLHGMLWQGLHAALRRASRPLALGAWPLLCLGLSAVTAVRLGGVNRLGGRYHDLAVLVLALCAAGAIGLGLVLAAVQPTPRWPHGLLASQPRRTRIAAVLALLGAAAALFYADRVVYVDLYQAGHVAMRVAALWLAMIALSSCDAELRLPRLSKLWLVVIALWTATPVFMLDEHSPRVLQGFGMRSWPSMVLTAARHLVDFDGDGHASLLGGGDCAALDPRIHPGAREIPDNGIDDNCVLGDARRRPEDAEAPARATEPSPLDVVLITVDALRPDHLGVYNTQYGPKGRATSPNIDRWASRATVFRRAYTPGAWTSIAIPALMRGVYPRQLRWTRYFETNRSAMLRKPLERHLRHREHAERMFPFAYDDPRPPLAVRLKRRGMYTGAAVDDGYSEILRTGVGIEAGFDSYYEIDHQPPARRNDKGTAEMALDLLSRIPQGKRFFLWLHFFGPHGPDEAHPEARVYGTTATDLYDHEINYLDQQLAPLFAELERRAGKTAVFLTADHGETIFPTVRYHGHTLEEAVLRIPLIARVPGWPARKVRGAVSLIDLMPTVLALTRTPVPQAIDGIDLARIVAGAGPERRILFSDTWRFDADGRAQADFVAAYDGAYKVVHDRVNQYTLLHDSKDRALPRAASLEGSELSRAIFGYLDETGGALRVRD